MKQTGAITTLLLGAISFAVVVGFAVSSELFNPVGRAAFPAIVIEFLAAGTGIGCIIYGVRALRRTR